MAAQAPIQLTPDQLLRLRAGVILAIGFVWALIGLIWLRDWSFRSIFSSPIRIPIWPVGLVAIGHGAALFCAIRWPARCGWFATQRGTTLAYAIGMALVFLFTAHME